MHKSGDVILAQIQFTDSFEIKKRPCVILFVKNNNFIVAGITSNPYMRGITLTKKEGAIKDSVIKTNYIFTISDQLVYKNLFKLKKEKKQELFQEISNELTQLIN